MRGGSEPPHAIMTSPARKRALRRPSEQKLLHLIMFAEMDETRGIGAIVLDADDNVRFVNGLASHLLGISQDLDDPVSLLQCIDPMSRKSRVLRELQLNGIAFQVPTKIAVDPTMTASSDWLVTIQQHYGLKGKPLGKYVTLIENAEMAALAGTDALTGLANRRTFTQDLTREFGTCNRHGEPLSLVYIDVDHFKKFNDRHGHDVGDAVLKSVAECLRQTVRTTDIPCRLGGEEFAVILPRTDTEGALVLAEKLREAVEAHSVDHLGKSLAVTISVGVSTYRLGDRSTVDALVNDADHAMLDAKESGRNRVCLAKVSVAA